MKMVKNLSVANIKKIEGFVRREDLDFSDDGNRFRGFEYKGMPITTLRSHDETYLSIRVDYLENKSFTHNEWYKTEEYKLCDEFNGVGEFDLDKLIENLEKVIAKVNELNEKANNEEINIDEVKKAAKNEIEMAKKVIDDFTNNFKWFLPSVNTYKISSLKNYMTSLLGRIDKLENTDFDNLPIRRKKEYVERLNTYG
jgi:hypothetical protein